VANRTSLIPLLLGLGLTAPAKPSLAETARAALPDRPPIDPDAMKDALGNGEAGEHYASARAYTYYLKAQLEATRGDAAAAADDFRQAMLYDADAPEVRVGLAEQLERLGELSRAEDELRRAVVRAPGHAATQFALGRVLAMEHKLKLAVPPLQKAMQLEPGHAAPVVALAQVFLELGQSDKAIAAVQDYGAHSAVDGLPFRYLGATLADHGDLKKGEKLLKQAVTRDPGDIEALQVLAKIYEDQKRYGDALAQYEQALRTDPEEPNVLLNAGMVALKRNDVATARAYFDQLLSVMPDDAEVKVKVAFAWAGVRKLPEAAALLQEAHLAHPGDARLAFYAGLVQEDQHAFVAAALAFATVPAEADLYPEAVIHAGTCLSRAGRHGQALQVLQQQLFKEPHSTPLLVATAEALVRADQLVQAVALLQRAADADQSPELYGELSELYARAGKARDGLTVLEGALAKSPNNPKLLYAVGMAASRADDLTRATSAIKQLLALEPTNANALNFLGYTLADHDTQLDEAERLVKQALKLHPDSGAYMDSLGWIYFKRGDLKGAVATLKRATELAPLEPVIHEHLGDALVKAQRRGDGIQAYRKALETLELEPDDAVKGEIERKLERLSGTAAAHP
jgi:Flp pilus assembly protein TadD